jgi:Ca2+-binding EF-hand superfamily protein
MNSSFIAFAVLAAAGFVTGNALASEPSFPRSPVIFKKLDTDQNGKITVDELKPKAEKRLLRLDADRNQAVSTAEIDAYLQKRLDQERARMMTDMDLDRNGEITVAELDKFVDALFNGVDADKDGGVSLQEARDFKVAQWRKTLPQTKAN